MLALERFEPGQRLAQRNGERRVIDAGLARHGNAAPRLASKPRHLPTQLPPQPHTLHRRRIRPPGPLDLFQQRRHPRIEPLMDRNALAGEGRGSFGGFCIGCGLSREGLGERSQRGRGRG